MDFFGPRVLLSIFVSSFQFSSYLDSPVSQRGEHEKTKEDREHIILKNTRKNVKRKEEKQKAKEKATTTITIFNSTRGKFSMLH